jgi:hypothetical protein
MRVVSSLFQLIQINALRRGIAPASSLPDSLASDLASQSTARVHPIFFFLGRQSSTALGLSVGILAQIEPQLPVGYSQEETIKKLWNHELKPAVHAAGAASGHHAFVPQDYGMPMNNVADVAVGSKNNVFCDDTKDHVVSKFTTDGKLLLTLGGKGVPSDSGSVKGNFKTVKRGAGPFNVPTATSVPDSQGRFGIGIKCPARSAGPGGDADAGISPLPPGRPVAGKPDGTRGQRGRWANAKAGAGAWLAA